MLSCQCDAIYHAVAVLTFEYVDKILTNDQSAMRSEFLSVSLFVLSFFCDTKFEIMSFSSLDRALVGVTRYDLV